MMIKNARLVFLLAAATATTTAASSFKAYKATIEPIPGVDGGGSGAVSGTAVVVTVGNDDNDDKTTIFYGGTFANLQPNLVDSDCGAENGCGLHIHSGFGCADKDAQGGHYYDSGIVATDPWLAARYSSDENGKAVAGELLEIGTANVQGRAMVIHAQDGSRIGCGLLQPIEEGDDTLVSLHAKTTPVGGSSSVVTGDVLTLASKPGAADEPPLLCYVGYATGLPDGVQSFLLANDGVSSSSTVTENSNTGLDCNVPNGCGTHIHSGTACDSSDTQGGHWYNQDTLETDPWATLGYLTTTTTTTATGTAKESSGMAWYGSCVNVGFEPTEAAEKPFIVHSTDGSRVSCGILQEQQGKQGDDDDDMASSGASGNVMRAAGAASFGFLVAFVLM